MKRSVKKNIAVMTALALGIGLFYPGTGAAEETTASAEEVVTVGNPFVSQYEGSVGESVWSTIYFGQYWRSKCDIPDGAPDVTYKDQVWTSDTGMTYLIRKDGTCYQAEPIRWRVLNVEGTDALLMTNENIEYLPYDEELCHVSDEDESETPIAWEESDVRSWLNDTTSERSFMNLAFTQTQQDAILLTSVDNETGNPETGTQAGKNTEDKVYLLSVREALTTKYGFSADCSEGRTRLSKNTDYVNGGGFYGEEEAGSENYWLRSPGINAKHPAEVGHWSDAEVMFSAADENEEFSLSAVLPSTNECVGVRPVLHLDLSDDSLWVHADYVTADGETWTDPSEEEIQIGIPAIKKLKNVSGKKVKLTLSKKLPEASAYRVVYSTDKKFKKSKEKKFTGSSVTIKNLKKKKYYFKVQACVLLGEDEVYGEWSKVKSVKVKK